MPADKGGLWVEDKLISGFNPVKTDTLFSLSPLRWSSWIGRVVPSPSLPRTAGSLSSQRPGAHETTYTDLRIWHFISRKNTLDTRMYFSEVMWPVSHSLIIRQEKTVWFGSRLRLYMRPSSAKNKSWERRYEPVPDHLLLLVLWHLFKQADTVKVKVFKIISLSIWKSFQIIQRFAQSINNVV